MVPCLCLKPPLSCSLGSPYDWPPQWVPTAFIQALLLSFVPKQTWGYGASKPTSRQGYRLRRSCPPPAIPHRARGAGLL